MRRSLKWKYGVALALAGAATIGGVWRTYSPAHWMTKISWATVSVDDRPVVADIYIGDPRESEAEAIALVHVPGVGDYFLDFGGENYREASNREFARLPGHAWTFKPMDGGQFVTPLPFLALNQCRFASHGHIVTVQF
jgi:hypothetical protein